MESLTLRKMSSPKAKDLCSVKRIKRIFHIKSLPAYNFDLARKSSTSKIQLSSKEEPQVKLKRFKTQQHLKAPHFGAVKTARERNLQWTKKVKQHPLQPCKSLTKSTNYKSPRQVRERKHSRAEKSKSKKCLKKLYSGILRRVKQVMEEYQIKIDRCIQQKQVVQKENDRLRAQLQSASRKSKRSER